MKPMRVSLAVLAVAFACTTVTLVAQDPLKVDPTHYHLVLENAAVRVLHITYAAGSKSVMHQHPDSIVYILNGGKVRFTTPDGKSQDQDEPAGSATYLPAGTHLPSNIGTTPTEAILVEFKTPKPGTAVLPTSRPGMTITTLAEGPRGMAIKSTADATFNEPAGTKHEFDQVVIATAPTQMSLSIEGKPAKTTWAKGDVQFIGRGVAHESRNTGGKPVTFAIIAIK